MSKGDSKDGWVAYVEAYKAKYPDQEVDYQKLMQKYIKGEPV